MTYVILRGCARPNHGYIFRRVVNFFAEESHNVKNRRRGTRGRGERQLPPMADFFTEHFSAPLSIPQSL